jgi:hypothetical protein
VWAIGIEPVVAIDRIRLVFLFGCKNFNCYIELTTFRAGTYSFVFIQVTNNIVPMH